MGLVGSLTLVPRAVFLVRAVRHEYRPINISIGVEQCCHKKLEAPLVELIFEETPRQVVGDRQATGIDDG